jgi:hypothetical protein
MGLFGRKKRTAATDARKASAAAAGIVSDEILSVIGAAVAASDTEEHLAVIAAAIATYEADNAPSRLCISKINRSVGVIPAWGVAGNRDAIDVRRI